MNAREAPLFTPLSMQSAPPASRTLLEQAHRYFGFVPNLLATMAHSSSALRVYLNADLVCSIWDFNSWRTTGRAFGRQQGK